MQMTFSKSKYPYNNGSGKENVGETAFADQEQEGS